MSAIDKEELIEWLEGSIAKDKEAMAEAHDNMSNYGRSYYIVQSEMTISHIRAMPSKPSDAELWAFLMSETLKMNSIGNEPSVWCEFLYQDEPHIVEVYYKPEGSETWTSEGFDITDAIPDYLRAILEPLPRRLATPDRKG